MGEHADHRAVLEAEARLVARWVGTNPGALKEWSIDEDAMLLVATVRLPLTREELERFWALERGRSTEEGSTGRARF